MTMRSYNGNNGNARSKWASRFILAAVIQGALAIGLTGFLLYQGVFGAPAASRIVAGGGAGTWLVVGYFGYLVLGVAATAAMGLFYWYLETVLRRPYGNGSRILAWLHLALWNVGVLGGTWLMMNAGYAGGAAAQPVAVGGLGWTAAQVHTIMSAYPMWIAGFLAVAVAGAAFGLIGHAVAWAVRAPEEAPPPAVTQT